MIQSDSQVTFDIHGHDYQIQSGFNGSCLDVPHSNFRWSTLRFNWKGRLQSRCFPLRTGWSVQSGQKVILSSIASFVLPFLVIVFLIWSVYKTAKRQIDVLEVQLGSLAGSESQQQEMSKRMKERKAAADITIIICAFVMCFLPS